MAISYKLNDLDTPLVFENPFVEPEGVQGELFNTGASATGLPHADEDQEYKGLAEIPGEVGPEFVRRHTGSIRLYKNNEYIYLKPGDKATIKVDSSNELAYYLGFQDTPFLKLANRDVFEVPLVG